MNINYFHSCLTFHWDLIKTSSLTNAKKGHCTFHYSILVQKIIIFQQLAVYNQFILTLSLDEKSNLHKICFAQTCRKYQLCKGLHPLRKWWLPSLHILCKLGNHHLRNGCKRTQSRYLQQVCTRQTLCKFDFSSSVYIPTSSVASLTI